MIHPAPSRVRPFERLASSGAEKSALLQAERNATSVLLNDWTHSVSDTIHAQYLETGAYPFCVDSLLANGLGRVQCLPESILQAGTGLGLSSPLEGITNTSVASSLMTIATMAKRVSTGDTVSVDNNTAQATTVMNTIHGVNIRWRLFFRRDNPVVNDASVGHVNCKHDLLISHVHHVGYVRHVIDGSLEPPWMYSTHDV
ncbi:hypothetical protein BJ546DRAFT_371238 [Cryomyces antarcticus]